MAFAGALTGIVAAIGLTIFLQGRPALTQAIVLGSVVVGIFILSSVYAVVMIRPLLVDIPATNERISFFEKFKARAVALPKAFLIVGAILSLVLFAGGLFGGLIGKWDLPEILSTVFFGALTLLYIASFLVRRAANRQV